MKVVDLAASATVEQIQSFNQRFNPEPRLSDPQFLNWKYRTPTEDGTQITSHLGIVDGDQIAAQVSVQRMRAWLDGRWQECSYWADWFSNPAYGGAGLLLLNHIIPQNGSLLATSASDLAYAVYQRLKFVLMPIDQRFVFVSRPMEILSAARSNPRRAASLLRRWTKRPLVRVLRPALEAGLEISPVSNVDSSLLDGWELDAPSNTIFVRREDWAFSWLLEKFPYPEFRILALKSSERQIGYVLLHLTRKAGGLKEGKIVDLNARGWNKRHLVSLFRAGAHDLINQGAHVISYHASHPLFTSLARENNFAKVRDQCVIMYGPVAETVGSGNADLHVTYYDHDEAYY